MAISFGAETQFESGTTYNTSVCRLDDTHFIISYVDVSDSYHGKLVVCSLSGNTVTVGTIYTFRNYTTGVTSIKRIDDTHAILAFSTSGTSKATGFATVVTTNGSTSVSSIGSLYQFESSPYINTAGKYIDICDIGDSKFVIYYYKNDGSLNKTVALVASVSGNVISYGTEYSIGTGHDGVVSACRISDDKFVSYYKNGCVGYCKVCTVSGTTISCGSSYSFGGDMLNQVSDGSLSRISDSKFMICYKYGQTGSGKIGAISGSTISYSSIAQFEGNNVYSLDSSEINSSKSMVIFLDLTNSIGQLSIGNISASLSFDTPVTFNAGNSNFISSDRIDDTHFAIAFMDSGDSNKGKVIIASDSTWIPDKEISFIPKTIIF